MDCFIGGGIAMIFYIPRFPVLPEPSRRHPTRHAEGETTEPNPDLDFGAPSLPRPEPHARLQTTLYYLALLVLLVPIIFLVAGSVVVVLMEQFVTP
jgi:hypothetical protein